MINIIGLLDYDWLHQKNTHLVPNLEIMKLATYYHIEEKTFCRLLTLDETNLNNYQKIYFFSETTQRPVVPPQYLREKNVIYGGTAFTRGKYFPFENSIIDYTIPRPFIYKEALKQKYQEGVKAKIISSILDSAYYRIKVGDSIMPIPPIMSRQRIYIYDRNIFVPQYEKILNKIIERNPSSIIPIHPVECRTLTEYFTIRKMNKFKRDACFILNIDIPLFEAYTMMNKYKNNFQIDITKGSTVYIPLGGSYNFTNHYIKDFFYKINLLYIFWSKNIPIKIKYIEPNEYYINPLAELEQVIANWSSKENCRNITLDDKIHNPQYKKISEILKEQKLILIDSSSKAKNIFNQSYDILSKGGFWRV